MTVKGKIKFKGVVFYVEGPKVANAGYAREHTGFRGLCIKCAFMLKDNKQDLLDGKFERLGRVSGPFASPVKEIQRGIYEVMDS